MIKPAFQSDDARALTTKLFGIYKAEWYNGHLFDHFSEPDYFRELASRKPCVLIGGRGTGKTTVLRGLSYVGQFKMTCEMGLPLENTPYIGLYYRVNTSRVMAFQGPELDRLAWCKYFGHYFNLTLCSLLVEFLLWYEEIVQNKLSLDVKRLAAVSRSLHVSQARSLSDLSDGLHEGRLAFEAAINNVGQGDSVLLSLLGAPIDELVDTVLELSQFSGKQVFFLLDEYENFQDYQQQVVNTIIKQASNRYVFKVGVRELGWRERTTLNTNERLTHPADYVRIDLREKFANDRFREFASRVCNSRLRTVRETIPDFVDSIEAAFPELTEDEEAGLLGIEEHAAALLGAVREIGDAELTAFVEHLSAVDLFFIGYWADSHQVDLRATVEERKLNPDEWTVRKGNYLYSALFSIRRGKRGIRKYYSGWQVLVKLADGNIRYLLQLIDESFRRHFEDKQVSDAIVRPEVQTLAAQAVGRGNLDELEGLSIEGARLTRLVLGLGRIFGVLAEKPEGHTPEVNQFHLGGDARGESGLAQMQRATTLLDFAVMHQALVRFKGTKLTDEAATKDYDYMVHPIFSAFFVMSHRKKRKLKLTATQLLGLVESHQLTIREILDSQNRPGNADLPDQLTLFGAYFSDND